MSPRTRIAGHRGHGANRPRYRWNERHWPENTLPSFLAAVDAGAELVELDVQHSADGHLVVIHDDRVDRTTRGRGCVQALTLEELRRLPTVVGAPARIPTLEEVIAQVPVGLNVEIKLHERTRCPRQDRARLAADVVATLAKLPADRELVLSSFDLEVLREVRRLDSGLPLGYLTEEASGLEVAIDEGMAAAHPASRLVTEAVVARLREAGLRIHVWTVNEPRRARALMALGVDMLITDRPGVLRQLRDAK